MANGTRLKVGFWPDLDHVVTICYTSIALVSTTLYAPRRWESKLTSDALFVSSPWGTHELYKVKQLYSQTTDYQVFGVI